MPYTIWNNFFSLFLANPSPTGKLDQEQLDRLIGEGFDYLENGGGAVALRWQLKPELGLPREPFKVWVRNDTDGIYDNNLVTLRSNPLGVDGTRTYMLNSGIRFYKVLIKVGFLNSRFTVQALDYKQDPILGEQVVLSPVDEGIIRFKHPEIAALRFIGVGVVESIVAEPTEALLGDGWTLVEEVGIPFVDTGTSFGYARTFQGKVGALVPAEEAALERLRIGEILFNRPPATSTSGHPAPNWPNPDPNALLEELTVFEHSPVPLLREMFSTVSDEDWANRQVNYEKMIQSTGPHQPGRSNPRETTFGLSVAGLTCLSGATDYWTALGLGFGTHLLISDGYLGEPLFVNFVPPQLGLPPQLDYRVTGTFTFPYGLEMKLAAIGCAARFAPPMPRNLGITTKTDDRPPRRNDNYSRVVSLNWDRPAKEIAAHGYALGLRRNAGDTVVLNEKRLIGESLLPFIPSIPADTTEEAVRAGRKIAFLSEALPVPHSGADNYVFMTAALDVFGRWSNWNDIDYRIEELQPKGPRLGKVDFEFDLTNAINTETERSIRANLVIELLIDWEDRSPHTVSLVGQFISNTTKEPPAAIPAGLQKTRDASPDPPVLIEFSAPLPPTPPLDNHIFEEPAITSGSIQLFDADQPEAGQVMKYKIIIPGFDLDFTAADTLSFVLYSRLDEKVSPGKFSDYRPPRPADFSGFYVPGNTAILRAKDPLPTLVPEVIPDLRYTALPDATGRARILLDMPTVPFASGYNLYEATEAAMRVAAGLSPTDSTDLIERARELTINEDREGVSETFARVQPKPYQSSKIEVTLPASASGIYAFRMSSITAQQVESGKTASVYVAVARQLIPATPILEIQPVAGTQNVIIKVSPKGNRISAGIHLYRGQAPILRTSHTKMGPPVIAANSDRWTRFDAAGVAILPTDDTTPVAFFQTEERLAGSWFPYFYRAVALGLNDPANGIYAGRSNATPAMEIFVPPDTSPDIQDIELWVSPSPDRFLIRFKSSAVTRFSPRGSHILKIATVDRTTTLPSYVEHISVPLPEVPSTTTAVQQISRGNLDDNQRYQYEALLPKDAGNEARVQLIDPLGRITELSIPLEERITRFPFMFPSKFPT